MEEKINVLILGSGGREHALARAIQKSPRINKLYITSTNTLVALENSGVNIDPMDHDALKDFVKKHNINLIIPGSEVYLEDGIANLFQNSHVYVFGPTKEAARMETSKSFAKLMMEKYNIPTASSQTFDEYKKAKEYVIEKGVPIVIKYDGLAAGKGVVVAFTLSDAFRALDDMLNDHKFGNAKVVIEDYLEGEEFSFISLVKGKKIIPLPVSKDYKRLFDGDKGPNTGGMGAVTPVDFVTDEMKDEVVKTILKPVINGLIEEGLPYLGFLYAGLILTKDGPKVIEFNCRLGDPETEVILAKVSSDLLTTILDLLKGKVTPLTFDNQVHLGVVLASSGYPNHYEKGFMIEGNLTDPEVYHMGVNKTIQNYYTNGGRVLFVKGHADTFEEAKRIAYEKVKAIQCPHLIYRTDIGKGAFNG